MVSYHLLPHILLPSSVTDHSATVDNIFINAIEYDTISGNILDTVNTGTVSYRSTLVRSKKWYAFTRLWKKSSGLFQNRSRNWAVWKSEPEIGMIQYRTIPFLCEQKTGPV